MVVSGSADGSVLLSNLNAGWFRRRGGVRPILHSAVSMLII